MPHWSTSTYNDTPDIVRFQSQLLHSPAAVLTALVIKSTRLWKDTGRMRRRGIRVFISPLLKWLSKESKRSWFMSPLLPLFFLSLPFISGGLCELAWLAEQLPMWDTTHICQIQSIKTSEFRTFIFFNYGNHMPQIFPIKSRGRAFFLPLSKFSMRLPREAGRGNNTSIAHYRKCGLDSVSLTIRAGNNKLQQIILPVWLY